MAAVAALTAVTLLPTVAVLWTVAVLMTIATLTTITTLATVATLATITTLVAVAAALTVSPHLVVAHVHVQQPGDSRHVVVTYCLLQFLRLVGVVEDGRVLTAAAPTLTGHRESGRRE